MSAAPVLSNTDIEARIASIAGGFTHQLTAEDTAWVVGKVRHWLSSYAFNEASLVDSIKGWVRACAPLVDMDGQPVTIGTTLLVPFAKGGAGNAAHMRRMVVVAIHQPEHRGYGYFTRGLTLKPLDGGKNMHHHYANNCLVFAPPAPASTD